MLSVAEKSLHKITFKYKTKFVRISSLDSWIHNLKSPNFNVLKNYFIEKHSYSHYSTLFNVCILA